MLEETFGLVGVKVTDPLRADRQWTLDGVYLPVRGRLVGGIRAHATDQKGFASFINQRDLEVLLGVGQPGTYCRWLGQDYVDPLDKERWFGFVMDDDDLTDDLYAREQEMRLVQEEVTGAVLLPEGVELTRRIHLSPGVDCEELLLFAGEQWFENGVPDFRVETAELRWRRVERIAVEWRRI